MLETKRRFRVLQLLAGCKMGGLEKVTPVAAGLFVAAGLATAGLPGLSQFVSEILVREGRTMVATLTAESLVGPVHETLANIRSLLAGRSNFEPALDERTFTVMTSDYSAVAVLHFCRRGTTTITTR